MFQRFHALQRLYSVLAPTPESIDCVPHAQRGPATCPGPHSLPLLPSHPLQLLHPGLSYKSKGCLYSVSEHRNVFSVCPFIQSLTHPTAGGQGGPASGTPGDRSSPRLSLSVMFYLFAGCLRFLSRFSSRVKSLRQRPWGLQSLKYLLSDCLPGKRADSCFRSLIRALSTPLTRELILFLS